MQQGLFVQNYTSVGYKVVNCPKKLYAKLKKAFHEKFADRNKVDTVFTCASTIQAAV